ncbi:MAG: hypothetical protein V3U54_13050 [Thermodesulfobacteriota bacterium]
MILVCSQCGKITKQKVTFAFPSDTVDRLLLRMRDKIIETTNEFDNTVQEILRDGVDRQKLKVFTAGFQSIISLSQAHQRTIQRFKVK